MKRLIPLALLLSLASLQSIAQEKSWWDRTKVGVLAFGDYYYLVESHDPEIEGENGFWMRRIYLTVDHKVDDRLSARLRLEMNHPGDFTSASSMDPFVKDAWLKYNVSDRHAVVAGISPTPSFALIEDLWGYRPLEKTPNDLFRIHSSRDFGLAAQGALSASGDLTYHVMFGNGSGTSNESNEGKYLGGALTFEPNERFLVQIYADHDARPGDTDRMSFQGFAFVRGDGWRVGLEYINQERDHPAGSSDLGLSSIFGVFDLTERSTLIARWDHSFDPIPDADRIAYVPVAGAEVDLVLVGVDLKLHPNAGLIPNVEYLSYGAIAGASPDDDILPRLTFYLKF